jgi:hypothetical protein
LAHHVGSLGDLFKPAFRVKARIDPSLKCRKAREQGDDGKLGGHQGNQSYE